MTKYRLPLSEFLSLAFEEPDFKLWTTQFFREDLGKVTKLLGVLEQSIAKGQVRNWRQPHAHAIILDM